MAEKSERRQSFFANLEETAKDKEKKESVLEEWDKRWGMHNLDFVNVLKYPEEYVEKIQEEREMWIKGITEANEKTTNELRTKESEELIINEDILTDDQKASLRDIDSNIEGFISKAKTFLKEFEVYTTNQKAKRENIKREIKIAEDLALLNK